MVFLFPTTEDHVAFRLSFTAIAQSVSFPWETVFIADPRDAAAAAQLDLAGPKLLVVVYRDFLAIGPLQADLGSACWACASHWYSQNYFDLEATPAPPGATESAELKHMLRAASANPNSLRRQIATLEIESNRRAWHPVFPLRDCPHCGALAGNIQDIRIHASRLTGIVRGLQLTPNPVAGAYRARASWMSPLPVHGARPHLDRQRSYGRGATPEQAELGCIGEALERYSSIYRGDERLRRGTLHDCDGVDPRSVLLYSDHQYATRASWNATADERYFVGEPIAPEQAIDWIPAADLIHGGERVVPAALSLMWYGFRDGEPEYARADSIGCGGGLTFADALLHALLEWVERDAMAIWWYNRLARPAVDLHSFDDPKIREAQTGLKAVGRTLHLLDCTTDLGIPAYISISLREDGTEPLFAGAAHLSPQVAAWKAASEAGQVWFEAAHTKTIDVGMVEWLRDATLENQPYLAPAGFAAPPPEPFLGNTPAQVREIVQRLAAAGLEAYAVDLSRTDVLTRTVRAVVPGLRHIWNRRAPGRLYEVPVKMGWLREALGENELNSICCMI